MSPERGFSVVVAIFLLVVLAALSVIIVSVTGIQQASGQLDVLGVRAYHAARGGLEWGVHQVVDPNNSEAACGIRNCPASTNLSGLPQSLSPFTVTVTCSQVDATEGNRNVRVFTLVATACNQPSGGACPNAAPAAEYVQRQLQASVAKCKDPTAAAPRCECG
jgi:MSHA biogenesis protein MshP